MNLWALSKKHTALEVVWTINGLDLNTTCQAIKPYKATHGMQCWIFKTPDCCFHFCMVMDQVFVFKLLRQYLYSQLKWHQTFSKLRIKLCRILLEWLCDFCSDLMWMVNNFLVEVSLFLTTILSGLRCCAAGWFFSSNFFGFEQLRV